MGRRDVKLVVLGAALAQLTEVNPMENLTNPDGKKLFLLQFSGKTIVFKLISEIPKTQRYYLLRTCESYVFVNNSFTLKEVNATLYVKKDDTEQVVETFEAKTIKSLLQKVSNVMKGKYLSLSA